MHIIGVFIAEKQDEKGIFLDMLNDEKKSL